MIYTHVHECMYMDIYIYIHIHTYTHVHHMTWNQPIPKTIHAAGRERRGARELNKWQTIISTIVTKYTHTVHRISKEIDQWMTTTIDYRITWHQPIRKEIHEWGALRALREQVGGRRSGAQPRGLAATARHQGRPAPRPAGSQQALLAHRLGGEAAPPLALPLRAGPGPPLQEGRWGAGAGAAPGAGRRPGQEVPADHVQAPRGGGSAQKCQGRQEGLPAGAGGGGGSAARAAEAYSIFFIIV